MIDRNLPIRSRRRYVPDRIFADRFNMLDIFNNQFPWSDSIGYYPTLDRVVEDGKMIYKMDLPGVSREDINIDIEDDILTISGERKQERQEKGYFERSYGSFKRSVQVPKGTDADTVDAKLLDGVLHVSFPFEEGEKKSTRIPVE